MLLQKATGETSINHPIIPCETYEEISCDYKRTKYRFRRYAVTYSKIRFPYAGIFLFLSLFLPFFFPSFPFLSFPSSLSLSLHPICLSVCLSVCLPACLPVPLSLCLFLVVFAVCKNINESSDYFMLGMQTKWAI